MLRDGNDTSCTALLLSTGVVLEQARELVTLQETGPLTGAVIAKNQLPTTVMLPGDQT